MYRYIDAYISVSIYQSMYQCVCLHALADRDVDRYRGRDL